MKLFNFDPMMEGGKYPEAFISVCDIISHCHEQVLVIRLPLPWKVAILDHCSRNMMRGWAEIVFVWVTMYGPCGESSGMPTQRFHCFKNVRGL